VRDKTAEAGRIVVTLTAVTRGLEGGVKKFTPPTDVALTLQLADVESSCEYWTLNDMVIEMASHVGGHVASIRRTW
jgi:hypothetical protein